MTSLRILSTVNRDEFFGRDAELQQLTAHAWGGGEVNGMLLASMPGAGAGELLRQAYDQLFLRRGDSVPIHFVFKRHETNHADIAARFFQNLIQQYVAYRRVEPELGKAPLTISELAELASPGDYDFISELVERFQHERTRSSQSDFVR